MSFAKDGHKHFPSALAGEIAQLEQILARFDNAGPGTRIADAPELAEFLARDSVFGKIFATLGLVGMRPVRSILFDKRPDQNWSLGWHQDRTICVRARAQVEGFRPFSRKQGLIHVEPPFEIIERMVTLRIHLDPVPEDNAPLLVAGGSHRLGKIPVGEVEAVAATHPILACLADRGDVWAYSTPIIHASKGTNAEGRRRVLQVDYSPDDLPLPLQWLGI